MAQPTNAATPASHSVLLFIVGESVLPFSCKDAGYQNFFDNLFTRSTHWRGAYIVVERPSPWPSPQSFVVRGNSLRPQWWYCPVVLSRGSRDLIDAPIGWPKFLNWCNNWQ